MAAKDMYKKPLKIVGEEKTGDSDGTAGRMDKTEHEAEKSAGSGDEHTEESTAGAEPKKAGTMADVPVHDRHIREVTEMHARHQDERADMHKRHEKEHAATLSRHHSELMGEEGEGKSGTEPR